MTAKILLFETARYRHRIDTVRGDFSRTWLKIDYDRILLPILECVLGLDRNGFQKAIVYMVQEAAIPEPRVDALVGYIVRMYATYIVPEIDLLHANQDMVSCTICRDTIRIVLYGGQDEKTS